MKRASLDKQPHEVAAMFDDVAAKYDSTNDLLSLGQTKRWRRQVVKAAGPRRGQRLLDIAAGTGSSSEPFADLGLDVTACDFSTGMLEVGRRRRPDIRFVEADATDLPFGDDEFDIVTISFGLRNINDPHLALREMLRVAKPAATLLVCEFSHPVNPAFRALYSNYLMAALPAIADRTSSNPDAYRYLAESIRAWPAQDELAGWIRDAGWESVTYRNLSGGVVAMHRAFKPEGGKPHSGRHAATVELPPPPRTHVPSPEEIDQAGELLGLPAPLAAGAVAAGSEGRAPLLPPREAAGQTREWGQ